MTKSRVLTVFLASCFLAGAAFAVEIEAKRGTIEAAFAKAAQGRAELLGCMVLPQNRALEICAFQAGEGIAISFLFDSETKAFRATSLFFAEKEADLAIDMGKAALQASNYVKGESVDFRQLMREATLAGKEIQLSHGVAVTLKKTPPHLYIMTFGPSGG